MGLTLTKIPTPPDIAKTKAFAVGQTFSSGIVIAIVDTTDDIPSGTKHIFITPERKIIAIGNIKVGGVHKKMPQDDYSHHSTSQWRKASKTVKRVTVDGTPPSKFMSENINLD